ncbi:ParH-like protein [Streptomyces roseifaciens]|nr:ParH-like protein [Streptomyces roseifaciens]
MHWRHLRRRCQKVIGRIPVPDPFSAQDLCERLAAERDRPLRLLALPTPTVPGTPSGMLLSVETQDFILYDGQTSPLHQEHIIVHEIGHLVCNHRSALDDTRLHRHLDITDPQSVRRVLPRIRYGDEQEQEAEMIATLILEAAGRVPAPTLLSGMLGGLESAMGLRVGRPAGASCSPG